MSHKATNWAIEQKGLKPIAKIILWHLCDRYHKDNGCFPSQDTLAQDCEISRSSLNRHLDHLEAQGLIRREKRWDAKSRRQDSTRYRFPFEFAVSRFETGGRVPEMADPVSQNSTEPCPKNGDSRVSNRDTNPVREPGKEPGKEPCAQEREDLFDADGKAASPSSKADKEREQDAQFEELWAAFPRRSNPSSKKNCRARFRQALRKVDFEDLLAAAQTYAAYCKREATEPQFIKGLEPWLNGEMWELWTPGPDGGSDPTPPSPRTERLRRIALNGGFA